MGLLAALVAPLLLPIWPTFSGSLSMTLSSTVAAHLALAKGFNRAAIEGGAAVIALVVIALLSNASVSQTIATALMIWLPVMILAGLVRNWNSVTLAMQVSVILATAAVLTFFLMHGDPSIFWNQVVLDSMATFREIGAAESADWLGESSAAIVPQMSMIIVFIGWSMVTLTLFLGYGLFQSLPEKTAVFGRFCDLNLGRVLAMFLAVASVVAVLGDWVWLQNIALMIFFAFWLQGLSILHWLHTEKSLPTFVLIGTYVLLMPLLVIIMIVLAILGYLDAWFDIRARAVAKQA